MITGCWQQRDDSNWNKKITREIFWTLKIFALSNFFSAIEALFPTLELCLMKNFEALFIGGDSDLKFYCIYKIIEIHHV